MGVILTTALIGAAALLVGLVLGMAFLAWPRSGRPGLHETETPQIVAGYWLAALVPPAGFGVGAVTFFKDVRHGLLIAGVAVLATAAYVSVLLLFLLA